jgi:hypothetical protein
LIEGRNRGGTPGLRGRYGNRHLPARWIGS